MSKPEYTFLLIDDQKAEMEAFINAGKQRRILVHAVDNVEDGLRRLKAEPTRYDAVILDAKCKLKAGDNSDSFNEAALRTALRELDEMKVKTGKLLPRCVYTAHSDAAANNEVTEQVFRKGGPGTEGRLFDYLRGEVNSIPTRIIERDYEDSLALCDDAYLPSAKREAMLSLLSRINSIDAAEVEQFMQAVRKFLEEMYKRMHSVDPDWLPGVLFSRGNPVLTLCSLYMAGVPEIKDSRTGQYICSGLAGVPKHISASIRFITEATHTTSHTGSYQPSQYALKGIVFSLLEVLRWFKNEVDLRPHTP